ncbi:MAG: carboxymuconolactone decarboxylase family protein [Actinobacteria bacterium]|nr:carboxymuconolactone decarboxylase family protein [Actinomycetota bacterium]
MNGTTGTDHTPKGGVANWHPERPERFGDPSISRGLFDRLVVAMFKLATRGRSYEVFRAISIRRGLLRPFLRYNARLMPFGKLSRRQTELVILRVSAICRSEYEWIQHQPIGRRAGLSAHEIELIGTDRAESAFGAEDRALLAAVEELLEDHALTDAMWDELRQFLSTAQIMELCLLAGHYAGLAGALNTFGVRVEPRMRR